MTLSPLSHASLVRIGNGKMANVRRTFCYKKSSFLYKYKLKKREGGGRERSTRMSKPVAKLQPTTDRGRMERKEREGREKREMKTREEGEKRERERELINHF